MDETEGSQCLGHSNWTICSPLSSFCSRRFSTFSPFILGGQFLLPQRANNGKEGFIQLQKMNEIRGFQCLGHSNWIICIPLSSFCSRRFSTFSPSYLGGQFLLPKRANNGSRAPTTLFALKERQKPLGHTWTSRCSRPSRGIKFCAMLDVFSCLYF